MPYAVFGDIQSEFKNITFGSDDAVSSSEVTGYITEEEAIINATISNRYVTPVTDTASTAILKKISIAYVAYRIAKILNLKKDIPIPEKFVAQDLSEGASYRTAKIQLDSIRTGAVVLNGAEARTTSQGVKSYNTTNAVLPLWERDKKQW